MGFWNSKEIVKRAKIDFEKTWKETEKLATGQDAAKKEKTTKKTSKPHKIFDTIAKLRDAYISLGFEETMNPVFIEDTEVYKQFGPEAVAVLDRVYYLSGLPRPDIGVSEKKLNLLKKFNPNVDKKSLERLLRSYKKGEMGGDDLIAELALALDTDDLSALKALDTVFPEFKELKPAPSSMTLRSHMTSAWFLTLQSIYGKEDLPIRLFSIDRCFRREQQEDTGHLRTYHSASCVIMDESFTLQKDDEGTVLGIKEGMDIIKRIYHTFKIPIVHSAPDTKRSKYYAPGTQFEVFGALPDGKEVEVATMGLYSPVALSRYGIEHPVLNIGIGVERIAMITAESQDIRELAYPQFYSEAELTDRDIAGSITLEKTPETKEGRDIALRILGTAKEHASEKSPCTFLAYDGPLLGRNVKISIVEEEEGTRLLGPAALNEIAVYDGNVLGISESKTPEGVREKGMRVNISYLSGIANLAAWEFEEAAKRGDAVHKVQVKGVKLPSDINVRLNDSAMRYITSKNKKIDIRGPVFTTVLAEFR